MLAVVLIRGTINTRPQVRETLRRLNLTRKNAVVFIEDTPQNRGMLRVVAGYVAFGAVSDETVKQVVEARGEEPKVRPARMPGEKPRPATGCQGTVSGKLVRLPIRLAPPKGGFERGGIKKAHANGGVLGERESMDALLTRMI